MRLPEKMKYKHQPTGVGISILLMTLETRRAPGILPMLIIEGYGICTGEGIEYYITSFLV